MVGRETFANRIAGMVGESIGLALIASAAACTEANKDTELFLRNVAAKLLELSPGVGVDAQRASFIAADMLMESEPRPGMCPTTEIRAH